VPSFAKPNYEVGASDAMTERLTGSVPTERAPAVVLLYSDDPAVRERMRLAIGREPAPDLSVRFVEASTYEQVIRQLDEARVDLMVLDGEATPTGGLGIARQLRDEYSDAPLTCVVIARAADRWLAAFARVDATLTHPLDPMTTGQTIARLLRDHAVSSAEESASSERSVGPPATP
jgi:CheY-like chemotaxis protein